jgi:predicted RNA-binding Zn-ribbon protein involved in translation (DUF1610 family)
MAHTFQRPAERYLHVVRSAVEGTCPTCGAAELAAYRVLSDRGFFNVVKCQRCLHSLEREPAPPFGSYVPLGLEIARGLQ